MGEKLSQIDKGGSRFIDFRCMLVMSESGARLGR